MGERVRPTTEVEKERKETHIQKRGRHFAIYKAMGCPASYTAEMVWM